MMKGAQTIMPGILTEDQIFRQVMRRHAAKGGKANTDQQRRARIRNLKVGRAALAAKRAKRRGGK